MDLKQIAKDTANVLSSYLTFQAVRTVLNQLRETDLPRFYWFNDFSTRESLQNGEAYLERLMQAQPDLALRIMTVRQHLAEEITEFLPEMVQTGIQHANIEHRKRHLEKITQMSSEELTAGVERTDGDDPELE
ncbi:chaperonin family protein RbcX [Romeria aff. gracilis LEGE 07310]|uniref:RuBisCO chaperone RbcX n=1 Tax=Vasconcelosia minhoensis LEGE 07310 TaxID=915328 RepID=A0A8J7ANL8_9CYAN|nr:chaperonin family protein RbcX [Romeria gracilis]MBE9078390.1 chaperonin family protein RbcX [Romeria aff. gracilis LEGE 07310]